MSRTVRLGSVWKAPEAQRISPAGNSPAAAHTATAAAAHSAAHASAPGGHSTAHPAPGTDPAAHPAAPGEMEEIATAGAGR
jgi:hypothetical protein